MAAVLAEVAFNTARTLLNDDAAEFYTDAVLLPKLVEAFRMLEAKLRVTDGSIMVDELAVNVPSGNSVFPTLPNNIIEPTMLWEKLQGSADTTYVKMTEYGNLPFVAQSTSLNYWQWDGTNVNFIPTGASVAQTVKMRFFGSLSEPTGPASSLVFIQAEYYLAPMTAAIMLMSIGEVENAQPYAEQADASLSDIIQANRGRIAPPGSSRP